MTPIDIHTPVRPGYVDPTPLDVQEMLLLAPMDERSRQIIAAFNKVCDSTLIEDLPIQGRFMAAPQLREAAAKARATMRFNLRAVDALDGLAQRLDSIAPCLEGHRG